jgi:peptidoglycan/LPS O-acetylase OafA/YrhL
MVAGTPDFKVKSLLPNQSLLRPYMPELDAIRGLAILGVLCYHGLYWANDLSRYTPGQRRFLTLAGPGQFGVNLFFVLSGFLITGILLDSRNRSDYFRRFYFRRVLRILPAYYATLLILVIFGLISRGFLIMSLFYSSNLSLIFGIAMSYPVLWSLAVEEHFYFVWPAVVKRLRPETLAWTSGLIVVLSPLLRFISFHFGTRFAFLREGCSYYTWNTLDGLALGALLSMFVRRSDCTRLNLFKLSMTLFVSGIFIALVGYPFGLATKTNAVGEALQWVPWNLCFGAMLGFALLAGSGSWKKLAAPRFLVFLGSISYGLYLYHLFGFQLYQWVTRQTNFQTRFNLSPWTSTWIRMLSVSLISILFAYLSRWHFEEKFLRLKDRLPGQRSPQMPANVTVLDESTELSSPCAPAEKSDTATNL